MEQNIRRCFSNILKLQVFEFFFLLTSSRRFHTFLIGFKLADFYDWNCQNETDSSNIVKSSLKIHFESIIRLVGAEIAKNHNSTSVLLCYAPIRMPEIPVEIFRIFIRKNSNLEKFPLLMSQKFFNNFFFESNQANDFCLRESKRFMWRHQRKTPTLSCKNSKCAVDSRLAIKN